MLIYKRICWNLQNLSDMANFDGIFGALALRPVSVHVIFVEFSQTRKNEITIFE